MGKPQQEIMIGTGGAGSLLPVEIEAINAYGPYAHAAWEGRGVVVTSEEGMVGRARFLERMIRKEITSRFTPEQISEMTIVDVGCYDGWLIHQLSDLPFRRLVGIDPREKNIEKGKGIRKILGIDSRCEFICASLESLGPETYDIVLCTSVLHHLASPAEGVAALHNICDKLAIIEINCLPSSLLTRKLKKAIELKDLPYFFVPPLFGLTGSKLESGYYDGSAVNYGVVSIMTPETLRMYMETQGFSSVSMIVSPKDYARAVSRGHRDVHCCCFAGVKGDVRDTRNVVAAWVDAYETGILTKVLDEDIASLLYARVCLNDPAAKAKGIHTRLMLCYLSASKRSSAVFRNLLSKMFKDKYCYEIIKNMKFNSTDKIRLEYAKMLCIRKRYDEASRILTEVTTRLNADWRATYRSFCLLSWIKKVQGQQGEARRYRDMCLLSNPQFPAALLDREIEALESAPRH